MSGADIFHVLWQNNEGDSGVVGTYASSDDAWQVAVNWTNEFLDEHKDDEYTYRAYIDKDNKLWILNGILSTVVHVEHRKMNSRESVQQYVPPPSFVKISRKQ